jgi:hypothetical protein
MTSLVRAVACLVVAALSLAALQVSARADTTTAATMLAYHNELRASIGAPALRGDSRVDRAAQSHADYSSVHGIGGHYEDASKSGYTGYAPFDRMKFQGYPATSVSEVATGGGGWKQAMTELWAAPYHRLGMMHGHNVVGGWGHSSLGSRERTVGDFAYDWSISPPAVLRSPAAGQTGIPTSWSGNESPSPLPSGAARPTGYPIMALVSNSRQTTLRSASIVRANDGATIPFYVAPPQFEPDYIVLIPQRPLEKSTTYRVRMDLTVVGQPMTESWSFTTSADGLMRLGYFRSAWTSQTDPGVLAPGQVATITVRFRNTGTEVWQRGVAGQQVNLGIPGDSVAYAAMSVGWPSANRVATTTEATVAAGALGTFTFQVRAPTGVGSYRLPLRPVIDGLAWLDDQGVYVPFVVTGGYHSAWVDQSPYPTLRAGMTTVITVRFRNTGARAWVKGILGQEARIGVVNDETRWAGLGVGWLYPNRPTAQSESTVGVGAIGTFTFTVKAPSTTGVHDIRLRPVIDGVTWMEDQGVFLRLTVIP